VFCANYISGHLTVFTTEADGSLAARPAGLAEPREGKPAALLLRA
jgi:hypothetical protein